MPDQTPPEQNQIEQPVQTHDPKPHKKRFHRKLAFFVFLPLLGIFLVAALAGKFLLAPTESRPLAILPQPTDTVATVAPTAAVAPDILANALVTVFSHGGLCMNGNVCERRVTINKDGTILVDGTRKGTLSKSVLQELEQLIQSADFAAIKAKKFAGTCPVAYDGQEQVYTFYLAKRTEKIASCEYEVDEKSPLFKSLIKITNQYSS